jgi:hypothetical protein
MIRKLKKLFQIERKQTMAKFVQVTRVYKMKGSNALQTQKLTVSADSVATIRPSNRLGYPEHRSTILLKDGTELDLTLTYSEARRAFGA